MIISDFVPFVGQHCETTTAGCLLQPLDIHLSEPMLFGLGEGLSFIYWSSKVMKHPFLGGRIKPDLLTDNLCRNLGLTLDVRQTNSEKKAWSTVENWLEANHPVGLKLDSYHLDYFNTKVHFAGHYVTIYGFDNVNAFLVDTEQQGGEVKTTLSNLALARNEKGPMSSRNLAFTIGTGKTRKAVQTSVIQALKNNATAYLNPPITNIAYKGIAKASRQLRPWFENSKQAQRDFQTTAMLMERAGTGGAMFRNLYRDFLLEAADLISNKALKTGATEFAEIALLWTTVANLFDLVGKSSESTHIAEASSVLKEIATREQQAMQRISRALEGQ